VVEGGAILLDGLTEEVVRAWPLDEEELPDLALSAWATPDPAVSAAPTPKVGAPAPSQADNSG
jgi:hypothetical protein